jgi:VWFA-related protein
MKYRLSVPTLLGLALLSGPGSPAVPWALAQAAPQSDETFYDTVEVNVVNVEVFVTDRDGKRVRGLAREDFEVLEDGRPVEITNFYASDAGSVAAATAGAAAEALVPDEQRLLLAIFVDNSNLSSQARNRVLPQIEEFLSTRLRPADRVVLSSYDGLGSLKIRQVPT